MSSLAWGRRLDIDQAGGQANTGQKADLCAAPIKPSQLLKVTSCSPIFPVSHWNMNPVDVSSHCEMILSDFMASTSAFVTTWCELVSLDVILSPLCLFAAPPMTSISNWKYKNFLIEICELRKNGCCGGAQLLIRDCIGLYRPQMRIQKSRLSYTATPKPLNLSQLVSAPRAPNSGVVATPSGQMLQLRHIL